MKNSAEQESYVDPYFLSSVLYGNDVQTGRREIGMSMVHQYPFELIRPVAETLCKETGLIGKRLHVAKLAQSFGADSLTQHIALLQEYPVSATGWNKLIDNLPDKMIVGFDVGDLYKGLSARRELKQTINDLATGRCLQLSELFSLVQRYNGTFRKALTALSAEMIYDLKHRDKKYSSEELGIYVFLLEMIEDYETLRHVQDSYVEVAYPEEFAAYTQAADELFGVGIHKREAIDNQRVIVDRYTSSLYNRLQAAGLYHRVDTEEFIVRTEEVLQQALVQGKRADYQELGNKLVGNGEFHPSLTREKSAGSVVLKGMRYATSRAFVQNYCRTFGFYPDIKDPVTWFNILGQMPDAFAFRVILPSRYHVYAVADYFIATAFGSLKDLNYGPSTFRDPRNEHFVDDKYQKPEVKMNGININLRDPQAKVPMEVQLMTGEDAFSYFHGPANHLAFKHEKNQYMNAFQVTDTMEFLEVLWGIRNAVRVS